MRELTDNENFLGIIITFCITLLILILSIQSYWKSENNTLLNMVKAGASPIEASLALSSIAPQDQLFLLNLKRNTPFTDTQVDTPKK